jgi:hypothetical protein
MKSLTARPRLRRGVVETWTTARPRLGRVSSALAWAVLCGLVSCNSVRKKECETLLSAMQPLDQPASTVDVVGRMRDAIEAIQFADEPLREYARSAKATLIVLSNTLALKDGPSPPDGTDDVIKAKLKEARTAKDDVVRYCSQ